MTATPFDDAIAGFQLGESETLLRLKGPEQFQQATLLMLSQTRRQVHIISPNLELDRFNNDEFADALSHFARSSRYTETRLLIGDPKDAIRWGHKVVHLAQRLSSLIQIRQIHKDDFDPEEAWIVSDDIGLIRRDGMDAFNGLLSAKSIPQAQRNNRRFAELWERSHEIADFRSLVL